MTIEEVATDIQAKTSGKRPSVIGIEGFGVSGKTTLAQKLADALGSAYVISMDDFIVKDKLAEPSWDGGAFDRKRLEDQVLRPLSEGKSASYQQLIWVDVPLDVAQIRGHARVGANENAKFWNLWATNDRVYQQHYRPEQRADYIVINPDSKF